MKSDFQIAVVGGGPSGLMAAEKLSSLGYSVTVYEQMPTVARKFLLAGKSGLNITHSEEFDQFVKRYGENSDRIQKALEAFTPADLRNWADDLGAETFVGSSGRVFPKAMKASPLLRAWLRRLEAQGVKIRTRHRWLGFDGNDLVIESPSSVSHIKADAVLFALGGASWPRLGSDAKWVDFFASMGIEQVPLKPANCGFEVEWTPYISERFAGEPVKSVSITSPIGTSTGEFVISHYGVEGSLIYAHSAALRDQLEQEGKVDLVLDLAPGRTLERLSADIKRQNSKQSFTNLLRKGAGLSGVKAALVAEFTREKSPEKLAKLIKALPIPLQRPRPIEEAISSAGGISWHEIDENYMLAKRPGTFVAGEMIDWEAPTGGYLLTACFAMGAAAARGMDEWLSAR